ncbi:MAG: uracil phosphoribosyltransferase [Alphaproteobacteria bacterium]|nr:uracil phosphoribosyltransferase [Alphaproteobacteria bacterium]
MIDDAPFENLTVVDHPLVAHKLIELRDPATQNERFRHLLRDISVVLVIEATRDLPVKPRAVETGLGIAEGSRLAVPVVVVPILRAGLGMANAVTDVLPDALEAFIGMYRDADTHEPVEYYAKVPPTQDGQYVIVDPMFATGGTATASADLLNGKGIPDENIRVISLMAAPEGITRFRQSHPRIPIIVAALDECLNDHDYIVPGMGDAGDRLFGAG